MNFDYKIKRFSRSRSLKIIVHKDGSVVLTAPKRTSERRLKSFLAKNESWVLGKLKKIAEMDEDLINYSQSHFLAYKKEAEELIARKVDFWSAQYEVEYNKIVIKKMKTRWGSCSSKGNLNFNYKLFFLPEDLQDYIIVHEICHLFEMNHSNRFWTLVEKCIPDYRQRELNLRKIA